MNDISFPQMSRPAHHELLYFWAFGDLHYRAHDLWHAIHSRRMAPMFRDVRSLWLDEGAPAFCVAPGDIVDTGAAQNYTLAKKDLAAQLGNVPLYPGIGNHEFHPEHLEDRLHTAEEFSATWHRPVRYAWNTGEVICIMLDQPNPYLQNQRSENLHVLFPPESLAFLDSTLAEYPMQTAVIFAHCPLRDTVLDRDPEHNLDDDSQDPFFFVENSHEVRAILARHTNACLYISGHTHSGWGSPNLVFTEILGNHPVTHLNLMSPWYTGRNRGPRWNADYTSLTYLPDDPDMLTSFAVHISHHQALIRMRDHRIRQWLVQWTVPLR